MTKHFVVGFVAVSLFAACSGGSDDSDTPGDTQSEQAVTGLGTACGSNSDCPENLACHVDHDNHVADGQCATFCVSNADCAKLGARAMCIGAGICVATCAADIDCPPRTRCADEGFCERTGSGSGKPYCSGTATPCGMLGPTECELQAGCEAMRCSSNCGALQDEKSCMMQQGCTWYLTGACGGTASTCSSLVNDVACGQQPGCTWKPSCTGDVTEPDCSKISATLCKLTPGCDLISG